MTLMDAVKSGICRVRDPQWAEDTCYLKLDLLRTIDNHFYHGPWVHLYSPVTQKTIGEKTPQDLICIAMQWDEDGWDEYKGEIAEGDTKDL